MSPSIAIRRWPATSRPGRPSSGSGQRTRHLSCFRNAKPTLANSYQPELLNLRTFPTLMGILQPHSGGELGIEYSLLCRAGRRSSRTPRAAQRIDPRLDRTDGGADFRDPFRGLARPVAQPAPGRRRRPPEGPQTIGSGGGQRMKFSLHPACLTACSRMAVPCATDGNRDRQGADRHRDEIFPEEEPV